MSFRSILAFAALSVLVVGCTAHNGPQDAPQKTLSEYVSQSFGAKSFADKAKLVALTTGDARATLDALDEKGFEKSFIDSKKEFVSMKIRDERKLSDKEVSLTYELSYHNRGSETQDTVTSKKSALFVNNGGKWLIAEVKTIKTLMEEQKEVSFNCKVGQGQQTNCELSP